jgi:ribosomal protein L37AE/L43A
MRGRDKFKMCRRKRRYTVRDAHRVSERLNSKQAKRVHQYRCPECGERHVGAEKGGQQNRREEPISLNARN